MSLVARIWDGRGGALSPNDDRVWSDYSPPALSGVHVTEDNAETISTVAACTGIITDNLAMVPLLLHRTITTAAGRELRERAKDSPLYAKLKTKPNDWQDSFEWREMMVGHALLRGNGYSEIVPGGGEQVGQIIPVHPARVEPQLQENGRIVYQVRQDNGLDRPVPQERMFHLRGRGSDGVRGRGIVELAREAMGVAMAAEGHAGRHFDGDNMPRGVFKRPLEAPALSPQAGANISESWHKRWGGLLRSNRTPVLEEGMEWQQIGISNEDSQFLESRHFQVADIARWFRVPLMLIQETEKSTSWGTGIEQFMIGFVRHTIQPWAVRFEQALMRSVVPTDDDELFAEFLLDGLLRGATKERFESYQIAAGGNAPFMTRNELRRLENLNEIDGLDEMLQPMNMTETTTREAQQRAEVLAYEVARRWVRKETRALSKALKRCADDAAAFSTWMVEFYEKHGGQIAEELQIDREAAAAYCGEHKDQVERHGARVVELCEEDWIEALARLAMGGNK